MGILTKAALAPFKGAYKASKWGIEQATDPGTPLYGKEREAYKEGKARVRKDEAFTKGYQKGGTFHQEALSQRIQSVTPASTPAGIRPTPTLSQQIQSVTLEPPKPPKPSLGRTVDMVREGKSDDEIMYIFAKEGKIRDSYFVLKKAKERVQKEEEKEEERVKRRRERSDIHAIRKTRKTKW